MTIEEYNPGARFPGVIGRTVHESQPAWPRMRRAEPKAPNVLFVVLDDTGYGHLGCFGSPIRTPNLDALATNGLRYANMHATALCSASRSCIVTGRNHHANGMATITELASGYPGSNGNIPFENGFLSEMLLSEGYNTFALGKWHLTPAPQCSPAGPCDRWPLGRGFERFYGFFGGDTHQYYPDLVYDNHRIKPPHTPDEGYHLTVDLVDRAIEFIADAKQIVPEKPFFMYFCTGAMHAPHHVPKAWADRYAGHFDAGWDAYRDATFQRQLELGLLPSGTRLSVRDPDVAPWDPLPEPEKRVYARMMEVFAGYLEHTDHHIGRLLAFLERIGQLDNTIVMVVSDNGASAEGGPHGSVNEMLFFNNVPQTLDDALVVIDEIGGPTLFNHYPWGWAWAGDTPFRRWKRETYRGGTGVPFIVHWPAGFAAKGEIRRQYAHLVDMVPTVLDALGLDPPTQVRGVTQSPLHGVSLVPTFHQDRAKDRHLTQYFEMFGHRAIDHDGWRAVCPVPGPSFAEAGVGFGELVVDEEKLRELDAHGWELYHVAEDPAETQDLAAEHRDRLVQMIASWYVEAGRYGVFPIDARGAERLAEARPQLAADRVSYRYFPGTSPVANEVAVRVLNRPHSITATVTLRDADEGVLVAHGGAAGGYALYLADGVLHYAYNFLGVQHFDIATTTRVPAGRHELRVEFVPTGEADVLHGRGVAALAQLYIDGTLAGEGPLPTTIPLVIGITEGLAVGRDDGSGVTTAYAPPFPFTGELQDVVVDVSGDLIEDKDAQLRAAMAHD